MYAVPARSYTIGCNASMVDTEPCTGILPDCDQSKIQGLQLFFTQIQFHIYIYNYFVNFLEICMLPMNPGSCRESYSRWYFDYSSKTCKKFKYSGCSGNANLFDKEDECEKTCGSLRGI